MSAQDLKVCTCEFFYDLVGIRSFFFRNQFECAFQRDRVRVVVFHGHKLTVVAYVRPKAADTRSDLLAFRTFAQYAR